MGFQTCSTHGIRYEDYGDCPQCVTERIAEESMRRQERLAEDSLRFHQEQAARKAWEHSTYAVRKDRATGKWVRELKNGERIEGLAATLNKSGADGWELVSLSPESWEGGTVSEVTTYRATFKRAVRR